MNKLDSIESLLYNQNLICDFDIGDNIVTLGRFFPCYISSNIDGVIVFLAFLSFS